MDCRKHGRARLRLPVRLRWATPFGQRIEFGETIDLSRSGLLVSTLEPHSAGVSLWVTFPYDSSLGGGQPEILACVVRCDEVLEVLGSANAPERNPSASAPANERSRHLDQLVRVPSISDAPRAFAVAVHFEEPAHDRSNGHRARSESERRKSPRHALAVPVRVRPDQIPWFEEAMAIDFSRKGLRFRSHREYQPGDRLKIAFEDSLSTPWLGSGEFLSVVVRVTPAPDNIALDVGVCRVE
jgi:hypothetical protein